MTGWAVFKGAEEVTTERRRRAGLIGALAFITATWLVGLTWHEMAVRRFAAEAGGLHGMIAKTIPNTTESRYTAQGHRYQYWAFILPIGSSLIGILLASVVATGVLHEYGYGSAVVGIWSWTLALVGALILRSGSNFIQAIDLFI